VADHQDVPYDKEVRPVSTDGTHTTSQLAGQVAVVTGAGRGLGRAFAQALAAAGAKVAITARTERELDETRTLIAEAGGTVLAFPVDVTDRQAMEQVIATVMEQLGPVDILVNNAAVINPLGYDWEIDPDAWWRTMEINVLGPYLCTHLVLPSMMQRRSGRIIHVTSGAAHQLHPYGTAYCTSKAAVSQLANLQAAAVKEYGITVFALAPGGRTAMIETLATSQKIPKEVNDYFRAGWEAPDDPLTANSVQTLMVLVSGQADQLTGRQINHEESIDDLIRRADEIVEQDLYAPRLRV
jgi:NAD(P)-dependent dehydrogenase (short-subunit alcohol dehydrogenase family)